MLKINLFFLLIMIFLTFFPVLLLKKNYFLFLENKKYQFKSDSKFILKKLNCDELSIKSNKIITKSNKKEIVLIGLSTMKFARYSKFINESEFNNFLKVLDYFFSNYDFLNSLQIYINPIHLKGQEYFLEKLIEYSQNKCIYLFINPTFDDSFDRKQIRDSPNFISNLALKYKDKKNLIFGIWAEANFEKLEDWENYMKLSVEKIRKNSGFKGLIAISGNGFGRIFKKGSDWYSDYNVILDFHDYPAENLKELEKVDWSKRIYSEFYENHPVIVGEFGGVWKEGFNSALNLEYKKNVLKDLIYKKISFYLYNIDPSIDHGLFDYDNFSLSYSGKVIFNYISSLLKSK